MYASSNMFSAHPIYGKSSSFTLSLSAVSLVRLRTAAIRAKLRRFTTVPCADMHCPLVLWLKKRKATAFRQGLKKQPHIVNARERLYDLFAKQDCRERPIFTVKSGGAQATTYFSSPEHPSESFRREVRVANSVLRANDHRDAYNNNRGCFFTAPAPAGFESV